MCTTMPRPNVRHFYKHLFLVKKCDIQKWPGQILSEAGILGQLPTKPGNMGVETKQIQKCRENKDKNGIQS